MGALAGIALYLFIFSMIHLTAGEDKEYIWEDMDDDLPG